MEVNLDGLRSELTQRFNELSAELDEAIGNGEIYSFRQDGIIEKISSLGQLVGILNCVFSDDDDGFSDLSEELTVRELNNGV